MATLTHQEAVKKVNDLIGNIKIAMLTTVSENGEFHSRPMTTQAQAFDGDLWFFAASSSDVTQSIERNPSVNVAYVRGGNYVSVAGKASIVTDVQKKKELWQEPLKIWLEDGPESPEAVLIKVHALSAQYWDTPGGPLGK